MPERFSADEARRIFARAARRQHAAPAEDGLTVDDLVAIGREAGLDPALVAAEAAVEGEADDDRRVRLLPSEVTDGEWERIVDLLRAEAGGPGVAQQVGRRREWTGPGPTVRGVPVASVQLVPVEGGTRLTIEPRKGPSPKVLAWALGGALGVNGPLYGSILMASGRVAAGLVLGVAFLLVGALSAWAVLVAMHRQSRTAHDRIDALLDRIDLAARAEDDAPRRPLLDLDELGDAPAASASSVRLRA